jgi:hypothetical protein
MFKKYDKLKTIILIITGWLMIGIGYTTKIGHPFSAVLFLGGIILFITFLINLFKN